MGDPFMDEIMEQWNEIRRRVLVEGVIAYGTVIRNN